MHTIELFAGAGGMALGAARAGFQHVVLNELDEFACESLRSNGTWTVLEADSREIDWAAYADSVDLLGAGAPCQPFSVAGLARGDGDNRNLFPEAVRAIREIRPQAVLFENVRGLGRPKFREYLDYICAWLAVPDVRPHPQERWEQHRKRVRMAVRDNEATYRVHGPTILNAADYGVPQTRQRLFVAAFRSDIDSSQFGWPESTHSREALVWDQLHGPYWEEHGLPLAGPPSGRGKCTQTMRDDLANGDRPSKKRWRTVRDALHDLPDPEAPEAREIDGHEPIDAMAKSYHGHTGNLLDWPGKTVKAGVHGVPGGEGIVTLDDGTARRMTVRETARLQSFPDGWQLNGPRSRALRQLGNAVPVLLGEALASAIRDVLDANDTKQQ